MSGGSDSPKDPTDPLRPYVSCTPEACSEILRALRRALETFSQWGIPVPRGSWIDESAAWLKTVVERNSVGENDEELRRTSAAASWAVDLYHISTSLAEEPFRSIAVELARITHGRLFATSSSAKSFLSQFWVGTLLAQSRLNPQILAYDAIGKPKPDYLIEVGRVTFAVEVKRPSSHEAARRLVDEAGDQIRRLDKPGIIILDVTDCLLDDPWAVMSGRDVVTRKVREELGQLHMELTTYIARYSRSNKFHQVVMLMTFARYWPWVSGERPQRLAGLMFRTASIPYRWSHQITSLSKLIQDSLLRGVEQLTGNPPEYHYS